MRYAHPGQPGAVVSFKSAYGNFIDGRFVEPLSGEFFMNTSPVDGSNIAQFPRSDARDIDFALDAAHRAAPAWGKTSVQQRSRLLLQVADRIEQHLEYLAVAESWDNGKPIRETLNADLPLAVDQLLKDNKAKIKILPSADKWFGVTYKEDRESVVSALQSMKDKGLYPEKLWD